MIAKEAIEAACAALNKRDRGNAINIPDVVAMLTAAFAAMPGPAVKVECPCTTFEQDEDCPIGYPSMLCSSCDGTGLATVETVAALAAEMLKIAEQVDELEDPFAAWETIELLKSQQPSLTPAPDLASENERMRDELMPMLHLISVFSDGINERNWADKATYIKQQVNRIRAALERT